MKIILGRRGAGGGLLEVCAGTGAMAASNEATRRLPAKKSVTFMLEPILENVAPRVQRNRRAQIPFHLGTLRAMFWHMSDSEAAKSSLPPRRRRGHRGGSGRGRALRPPGGVSTSAVPATIGHPPTISPQPAERAESAEQSDRADRPEGSGHLERVERPERVERAARPGRIERPVRPQPEAARAVASEHEPERQGSAVTQAIAEISEIVEALRRALEQMEDVLELTELVERQKTTDEREIESLRRALRQFQQRTREPRRHDDESREPRSETRADAPARPSETSSSHERR